MRQGKFELIKFGESGTTLKYRRCSPDSYKFVWTCRFKDGDIYTRDYVSCSHNLMYMIHAAHFAPEYEKEWNDEQICKTLEEHAIKLSDGLLLRQLRLYRQCETIEDCEILSKLYGIRVLPKLSKEYDHNYYVKFETLPNRHFSLSDSGYRILHVPWFAMGGKTHSIFQLNPHTKEGLDAAGYSRETITPEEYLALFDKEKDEI